MAISAVHALVVLAKIHADFRGMIEDVGIAPTGCVATLTVASQAAVGMLLAVAATTTHAGVITLERETRVGVPKDPIGLLGVACAALIGAMTVVAGGAIREVMQFRQDLRVRSQMTTAAIVQFVTIIAADSISARVSFMVESHIRRGLMIGEKIHHGTRFTMGGLRWLSTYAERLAIPIEGQMADFTIGLPAPILVTEHALTMIGALQIDELRVTFHRFQWMTIAATADLSLGVVMVTDRTVVPPHTRHRGMGFMIKGDRLVEIHHGIDHNDVR